jgi:hypothetical protein
MSTPNTPNAMNPSTNTDEVSLSVNRQKWRFIKDYDCHDYLVPECCVIAFHKLLDSGEVDEYQIFNAFFDKYRIDNVSQYTVENPVQDK